MAVMYGNDIVIHCSYVQ